ncbi:hypothetical protein [Sinorhizobium meliloti]|uniref:Uncharacterized protein n=1 Tax=Rhizobium meliloti TaxID=382 RepID=A0A2J0YTR0_RHIML|nr:hypothetical protein CEJ86_31080 [Sinorhizobium meliloti]
MTAPSNWFEREAISPKIYRVWEPHVHPFFRANIFHIVGRDADLVIDFGMGIHSLSFSMSPKASLSLRSLPMSMSTMSDHSMSSNIA